MSDENTVKPAADNATTVPDFPFVKPGLTRSNKFVSPYIDKALQPEPGEQRKPTDGQPEPVREIDNIVKGNMEYNINVPPREDMRPGVSKRSFILPRRLSAQATLKEWEETREYITQQKVLFQDPHFDGEDKRYGMIQEILGNDELVREIDREVQKRRKAKIVASEGINSEQDREARIEAYQRRLYEQRTRLEICKYCYAQLRAFELERHEQQECQKAADMRAQEQEEREDIAKLVSGFKLLLDRLSNPFVQDPQALLEQEEPLRLFFHKLKFILRAATTQPSFNTSASSRVDRKALAEILEYYFHQYQYNARKRESIERAFGPEFFNLFDKRAQLAADIRASQIIAKKRGEPVFDAE